MLTLDRTQAAKLTGFELLALIGQATDRRHPADISFGGREWKVYATRIRRRGTYVHLWREVERRVTHPDGTDTGLRVPDVEHLRVRADKPLIEFQEVH